MSARDHACSLRLWASSVAAVGVLAACASAPRETATTSPKQPNLAIAQPADPCTAGGLHLARVSYFNTFVAAAAEANALPQQGPDDPRVWDVSDKPRIHIAMRADRQSSWHLDKPSKKLLTQLCEALVAVAPMQNIVVTPVAPPMPRYPNMTPPFVPNLRDWLEQKEARKAAQALIGQDDFDLTPVPVGWIAVLSGTKWVGRIPRFMPADNALAIIAALSDDAEKERP